MDAARSPDPKHRQVYAALCREIQSGRWKRGDRLPSEAELVERFGVSRITIGRAVRDLQHAGPCRSACRVRHVRPGCHGSGERSRSAC